MIGFMANLPLTPPPDEPGTGGGSGLAGLMKVRIMRRLQDPVVDHRDVSGCLQYEGGLGL